MATATYDLIASQTLGSAASSITFSSIAASWTDLRLVVTFSSSSGFSLIMNGLNTNEYSGTILRADGTSASSVSRTNYSGIYNTTQSSTIPAMLTYDIFSYAGSTYKTVLVTESEDFNGSGWVVRSVWLCRTTSAITSLALTSGGTFNAGTTANLYGIKSA
jgi:hypothetical protein